jgi:NADH-quinone oxidoreductase subunit J
MTTTAFVIVAALAILSALGLILKRNPIHGALFLVVNLGCVAVFYLMLGAEFLAAAQVIVYAGAIMVLFVFAIMVLIPGKEETGPDPRRSTRVLALPVGGLLLVQLAVILWTRRGAPAPAPAPAEGGVESLGTLLFTDYLFPFELTSILLLAAMVGVLVLARRRPS